MYTYVNVSKCLCVSTRGRRDRCGVFVLFVEELSACLPTHRQCRGAQLPVYKPCLLWGSSHIGRPGACRHGLLLMMSSSSTGLGTSYLQRLCSLSVHTTPARTERGGPGGGVAHLVSSECSFLLVVVVVFAVLSRRCFFVSITTPCT